ncbi:metallophosphoesterase family protein [Fodinibius sediminis]|uniref:Calcineurin-like phosphoesterase n=1 Tax=Fodinibius sediminis TaxID=1214077 RepID=A0A521ARB4_9BACT|nr:metallophosphoesterase [Fodinibius sediminis]SMO37352.1 Calcineurin-like phosphoesterase [Fodinibius sediminis]
MDRKDFLKYTGSASLGSLLTAGKTYQQTTENKRRVLRIAHITDVHLSNNTDDKYRSAKGLEQCLHHLQGQQDPPDIIFNGGDAINDALGTSRSKVKAQWDLWHRILQQENGLPVIDCIGNHDVWGEGAMDDPLYGKKWAMEAMELDQRYYSFDRAGWHFIVLDSTHSINGDWYTARLDEEQFAWLKKELSATPEDTPVMVLSHIPIVCAAAYFDGNNEESGDWEVPGAWMHIDARRIVELFCRHLNVQLCLSGHIHLLDRVDYNDVTYYCNGAVSGNWWNGNYHQTPPGYAMVNLYEDGSFDREYITYNMLDGYM